MKYVHTFFRRVLLCAALSVTIALPCRTAAAEIGNVNLLMPVVVPEGAEYVVLDVLDGVEARYRTMSYNDIYGEYSCAGYVKAYYWAVYGINVLNLIDAGPPQPAGSLMQVQTPQKGDMVFFASPPNQNNHSAIVKAFDGKRIILIEQDYKWAQADGTYTYVNRTIPFPPETGKPYEIWRPVFVSDATVTEPPSDPGAVSEQPPTDVAPDEIGEVISDGSDSTALPEGSVSPEDSVPPEGSTPPEGSVSSEDPMSPGGSVPSEDPVSPGDSVLPDNPVLPGDSDAPEATAKPETNFEAVVTIGRMAMTVNGENLLIDAPALIQNNRTIMPVRWVGYALGLNTDDLHWNPETRTVTVFNNGDSILFTIDSDVLFINETPLIMDCPATLRQGRAYLPVRYLAEALRVDYDWDAKTDSVSFYWN